MWARDELTFCYHTHFFCIFTTLPQQFHYISCETVPGCAILHAQVLPCVIKQWQEWKERDAVTNWSLKALITFISLPWQKVIAVL